MTTTKLGLTETANGQANYLNVNTALSRLDQLVFARVVDRNLSAPPGSPANGAMYIPAATATGAWAGKENNLAWWLTDANQWFFLEPAEGMGFIWVLDEDIYVYFNGTAWVEFAGGGGGSAGWGDIGGTLSDQTDLQDALDEKEQVLTAGSNITIDRTDPDAPVISAAGSGGSSGGSVVTLSSASGVLDLSGQADDVDTYHVTLTEDVTSITMPDDIADKRVDVLIRFAQDGTGGWAVDLSGITWDGGGSPPTVSAAANAVTWITAVNSDQNGWEGFQ